MKNSKVINADTFRCDGERLEFLPGFGFSELQEDMNSLSAEEITMLKGIREIVFPKGTGDVDEEVWRALDQEDCGCLDHVEWLDFSESVDLRQDLCLSGIPELSRLVLPPNMEDLSGLSIFDCPKLNELHVVKLGKIGGFSDCRDNRYSIYASGLTDDFFESYADQDARNDFGKEVKTLFVPQKEMGRVSKLYESYPLAQGRKIDIQPLPKDYRIPDCPVLRGNVKCVDNKVSNQKAEDDQYWTWRKDVEKQILSEIDYPDTESFRVEGVSFNMKYVKGGTYEMKFKDTTKVCECTLSSFMIGETLVTQELWRAVTGNNPSRNKKWRLIDNNQHPVENVSPLRCERFLKKLSQLTGRQFGLPSQAEWQYAARGGEKSKGYLYAGGDNLDDVAWHRGNSGRKTHAVKEKKPNELGLYDMSGNVYEMCEGEMPCCDMPAKGVDLAPWPTGKIINGRIVYRDTCGGSCVSKHNTEGLNCSVVDVDRMYDWRPERGVGIRLICNLK